jgi:hypothetical protein
MLRWLPAWLKLRTGPLAGRDMGRPAECYPGMIFWRIRHSDQTIQLEPYHDLRYKPNPDRPELNIDDCRFVVSLQAWGFAPRAGTPQVAFGCDPTGRSVFSMKINRIAEKFYLLWHESCTNMI